MLNKDSNTILHIVLLISDLLGSALSLLFAFLIRYGLAFGITASFDQLWILWLFLLATLLINVIISPVDKFTRRGPFVELMDVVKRQFFICLTVIALLYLIHRGDNLSRLVVLYYGFISVLIIWLLRVAVKWYLVNVQSKKPNAIKTLIVTTRDRSAQIRDGIILYNDLNRDVCHTMEIEDVNYNFITEYITRNEVDEVFVSIPDVPDKSAYQEFLTELINMRIKVDIDIDQFELDIPGHKVIDQVGHFAVVTIVINTISISRKIVKRCMDILGGLVGSIIALIAFIILAPIIKADSTGPVIFSQKRVGKNGRQFTFYKFRSMCNDAEAKKKDLMAQNEVDGLMFKMEDDPRITKVGKFIRKTSIDELPQFWNVFFGDMSLVGTRPPTVDEYNHYEPWQKARLSMKPGITGMWQVSGRSDIKDFNEVVKLDMKYIDNWSFGLDIKILLQTVGTVFTGKGSR